MFGSVLATRGLLLRQPIDESLLQGEDLEWFLRLGDAGIAIIQTPQVVVIYQRRPDSQAPELAAAMLQGLGATVRRRRAATAKEVA